MVDRRSNPGDSSQSAAHAEFLELCALATSGNLSEEEKTKLEQHLAICAQCREAAKGFQIVVDNAIPALAEHLAPESTGESPIADPSFNQDVAEASFLKRLSEEKKRSPEPGVEPDGWNSPLAVRRSRNFRSIERVHLWVPLAFRQKVEESVIRAEIILVGSPGTELEFAL